MRIACNVFGVGIDPNGMRDKNGHKKRRLDRALEILEELLKE